MPDKFTATLGVVLIIAFLAFAGIVGYRAAPNHHTSTTQHVHDFNAGFDSGRLDCIK